jgi:hypothetical protein
VNDRIGVETSMNIARRKQLAETSRPLMFEGVPCKVGGWANEYATVTALFPGFYQATWETVERVVEGDGNFAVEDVTLTNMRWLGSIELPEKVREYFKTTRA